MMGRDGCAARDGTQVRQHVLLGVIAGLDRDDDHVGDVVEARRVLGGIVTRFVQAACRGS